MLLLVHPAPLVVSLVDQGPAVKVAVTGNP
jgi:hypothetical protein